MVELVCRLSEPVNEIWIDFGKTKSIEMVGSLCEPVRVAPQLASQMVPAVVARMKLPASNVHPPRCPVGNDVEHDRTYRRRSRLVLLMYAKVHYVLPVVAARLVSYVVVLAMVTTFSVVAI